MMIRIFLALITACVLCAQPVRAQDKTDRQKAGLIGPVKVVEAYLVDYLMKDGRTEPGRRRPWHSTSYNSEGNIVERTSYDHLGNISDKFTHTYDRKGRSTGYLEYSASIDKTLNTPRKHVYTVDERGNRVEYRVYDSDGSLSTRFTYKYDAKGNRIEEGVYYHTGEFGGKTVYTYDERGNQTAQAYYGADGILRWKIVSTYDAGGSRIERLQYQGDKPRYKFVSTYDDKGRILENETVEFNAVPNGGSPHDPEPGKVVFTYDDEKRTKEAATYGPDGVLKNRIVFTYDEKGTEVARATLRADDSSNDTVIQFYDDIYGPGGKLQGSLSGRTLLEIEYDSYGNWTKRTHLIQAGKDVKPRPYRVEQRVITYY